MHSDDELFQLVAAPFICFDNDKSNESFETLHLFECLTGENAVQLLAHFCFGNSTHGWRRALNRD